MTTLRIAADDSARLYRKVTLRLIPFLFVCYVLSFLDRVNVGYAHLQMEQDIGLSDAAYGFGAGVLFIGYLLFEIPSNLYMQRIGARRTISRIMFLWGLTSACMLLVRTPIQFYVLRFCLGVFEAGFFPGVILYLTYWYPQHRHGRIIGMFMIGIVVAGLIGGPLSAAIITHLNGVAGLRGWQWMFFLEGVPSSMLGTFAWFYLTDKPAQAHWLTAEQKSMIERDISTYSVSFFGERADHWGSAFRDVRTYLFALCFFAAQCGGYTVLFWMPIIIRGLGVSNLMDVGLYSAMPYGVSIIAMIAWGRHSDHYLERRWHFSGAVLLSAAGLATIALAQGNLVVSMVGLTVATAAIMASYPVFWPMLPASLPPAAVAAGLAFVNTVGAFGGFVSPALIGYIKTATGNINYGLYPIVCLLVVGAVTLIVTMPQTTRVLEPQDGGVVAR
ncbi:MFS transporter [Caballeronia sp. 15715]|uniref:MFS transporter n=1 Tax=Caballeronia sp. 15715 TaxID=3391030 RepID=UPI0039E57A1F